VDVRLALYVSCASPVTSFSCCGGYLQVSDELRYTGKDIRAYFDYFARVPGLALAPGSYKTAITIDGDVAVASGYYSFVLPGADGKPSNVPARFTFVFRRRRRASILPALEAEKRAAVEAQDYEKADAIKTQIAAALQEPTRPGWDIVAHHSSKVPAQPKYLKGVPQAAPPQPSPYVPAAHGYPTTNAALSRAELPPVKCNEDAARIAYETHKQEISAARAVHDSARFMKMQAPSSSSSTSYASSPAEDFWAQTRKAKQQPSGPPPAAAPPAPAPPSQAVSTTTSSSSSVAADESNGLGQFFRDLRKLAVVALVGVTLVSPQPGLPRFGGNQKVVDNEKDKSNGGVSLIKAAAGVIVGLAGLGWVL